MTKATIFFLCFLCVSLAHKDKKQPMDSIYEPFTDVPTPRDNDILETDQIDAKQLIHDHENLSEEKKQQYQQFNQMFSYGLIFGTILLAFMLMKTCSSSGRRNRPTVNMGAATQNNMTRVQMLQKNVTSHEIKNKIQWHKNQIRKLEQEEKQFEEFQRKALELHSKERQRQEEVLKIYYNQIQMQERIQPKVYYNQNMAQANYHHYQTQQYIPVGRPMPKDNDSSFASQYPVL